VKKPRDAYIIGATYFLSGLSLAIASYGENLIVHQIGEPQDVALYFRATIVFLFPGIVLNQYLAAIAGPMVRQNEVRVITYLRKYRGWIGGALLLLWPLLILTGFILEFLIYSENTTPLALILLLTFTSCTRITYVVPSSFVGVIANKKQLQTTTALYLVCALLFPVLAVIFVKSGLSVILAVALANLVNWALRSLIGMNIVIYRMKLHHQDPKS